MSLAFLAIGDWGRYGEPSQLAVSDALAEVAERTGAAFVVTTGDNFYDEGVADLEDPHWIESFEEVYTDASLDIPWYPVLGNHDHRGSPDAQIAYSRRSSRWRLPNRYHALRFPVAEGLEAELFFLDTTPLLRKYRPGGVELIPGVSEEDAAAELEWLENRLASSTAEWKIAVGHHPVFSGSPFHGSSEELQQSLLPLFESYGIDAYIAGHEHDLQHLVKDGVHHVVTGAGANVRESGALELTRYCESRLGFLAVELTGDAMKLAFFDEEARELYSASVDSEAFTVR